MNTPPSPHTSEHALILKDVKIGMRVTVHRTALNTREDYIVADLSGRNVVGDEGETADVTLRDEAGEEHIFSAADLGLLRYLRGSWNASTFTTRWEASLNTPILGDVPRP